MFQWRFSYSSLENKVNIGSAQKTGLKQHIKVNDNDSSKTFINHFCSLTPASLSSSNKNKDGLSDSTDFHQGQ